MRTLICASLLVVLSATAAAAQVPKSSLEIEVERELGACHLDRLKYLDAATRNKNMLDEAQKKINALAKEVEALKKAATEK